LERLVTTSQAAQILGLSLQGVHYRIKKNQLKSIKKSGKTFVYISEEMERNAASTNNKVKVEPVTLNTSNSSSNTTSDENMQSILDVKNEQIVLLKDSMKWMKKQYKSEINRLEKNQKRIVKVFNSEIKLLQSAFNEMRGIYKNQPQIQQVVTPSSAQTSEQMINEEAKDTQFITLKDFFVLMKRYNKTEKEIKMLIFKAISDSDERFIYNKKEKKLLIIKSDFSDLA